MKEHGRGFRCEPCREIIVFFDVSGASLLIGLLAKLGFSPRERGALNLPTNST
jgi:hypothetical protein